MIRVLIELWPHGFAENRVTLGEAFISNDGTGTHTTGNYDVRLMKSSKYAKSVGVWKRGRVEDFPRLKLGPWDLLYRALKEIVGYRNAKPWESSLLPTSITDTQTSSTSASDPLVQ